MKKNRLLGEGSYSMILVNEEDFRKVDKKMKERVNDKCYIRELCIQLYLSSYLDFIPEIYYYDFKKKIITMKEEGDSLFSIKNKLCSNEILKYCHEIAHKLSLIHKLGVIHGDISVTNFLCKDKINIIDFGGSQLQGFTCSYVQQTCVFSSPEILKMRIMHNIKNVIIDPQSEIWAYGMMLVYLFSKTLIVNDPEGDVTIANYCNIFGDHTAFATIDKSKAEITKSLDKFQLTGSEKQLISKICNYNPNSRITWEEICNSPVFDSVRGKKIKNPKISIKNRNFSITKLLLLENKNCYKCDSKTLIICKSMINNLSKEMTKKYNNKVILSNIVKIVNIITNKVIDEEYSDVMFELISTSSIDFFNPVYFLPKSLHPLKNIQIIAFLYLLDNYTSLEEFSNNYEITLSGMNTMGKIIYDIIIKKCFL